MGGASTGATTLALLSSGAVSVTWGEGGGPGNYISSRKKIPYNSSNVTKYNAMKCNIASSVM